MFEAVEGLDPIDVQTALVYARALCEAIYDGMPDRCDESLNAMRANAMRHRNTLSLMLTAALTS